MRGLCTPQILLESQPTKHPTEPPQPLGFPTGRTNRAWPQVTAPEREKSAARQAASWDLKHQEKTIHGACGALGASASPGVWCTHGTDGKSSSRALTSHYPAGNTPHVRISNNLLPKLLPLQLEESTAWIQQQTLQLFTANVVMKFSWLFKEFRASEWNSCHLCGGMGEGEYGGGTQKAVAAMWDRTRVQGMDPPWHGGQSHLPSVS